MDSRFYFGEISLLITHYNRSQSLQRLLQTFKDQQIVFGEIVVSDDCSNYTHQSKLKDLETEFHFKLISSRQNKGLGNNINKGQDAVTKPFTLYIQEDFTPTPGFAVHLQDALQLIEAYPSFDIVRFYAYFAYPYLKPFQKAFSEMVYNPWLTDHLKFYYYSDHPHLRRSSFLDKFGRYVEGETGDFTEYQMAISFLKHKGKGLFYNDYNSLFNHHNLATEPSTIKRSSWRYQKNALNTFVRIFYYKFKLLKGHLDLFLAQN